MPTRTMRIAFSATMIAMTVSYPLSLASQLIREPIRTPILQPTVYTGPAPTGFTVASSTPAAVSFTWAAAANATGYVIMRANGVGQPWVTLTSTPLPATQLSYSDQGGIDYRSSYIYRLQANYSGQTLPGYTDLTVTLPKPVNPTNVKAKQTNDGAVTISWWGTSDQTYMILGPGLPNGTTTVTGQSYTVTGLGNGQTYTWQVGAIYQPGNITTPGTEFPSASAAVLPFSGTYRVTLLGFTSNNPTVDDLLDSDGKADEIMPMVYVRLMDEASGNPQGAGTAAKGYIHGDNQGKFRSRIRAGTASSTGGIQKGDMFPAGLMSGSGIPSPTATTFPLKVWEGQLTRDGNVLVLYPSLWETDDAPSRWFDGYLSNLPSRTLNALDGSTPTGSKVRAALNAPGISEIRGDNWFKMDSWGPNPTGDRPIGIESVPGGDGNNAGGFFDRVIVLNQRKIEEALAAPAKYSGMPAGTIGLSFTEGGVLRVTGFPDPMSWNFPASYVLYLRVEAIR